MISPQEAQRRIARHTKPLAQERVGLEEALGRILATDVRSPVPLPLFDNSAMDGYALRSKDAMSASATHPVVLPIVDVVYAGDTRQLSLRMGQAVRIMTGAALPRGADAVLPQERADVRDNALHMVTALPRGQHVRARGEEVKKGERVARRGDVVHPGAIACLASVGQAKVTTYRRPHVTVIATGNETIAPGKRLRHGEIYDSNLPMLVAMLHDLDVPTVARKVRDNAGALANAVRAALRRSDVIVISGGVSVGERDFVRDVLAGRGVREIFWRVKQKPGKPLYFGVKGRQLVFGLPGNPASAFTCFYLYVYPALMKMSGRKTVVQAKHMTAGGVVEADMHRWRFMKARVESGGARVTPLSRQASHMTTSLARTTGIIAVKPGGTRRESGDEVAAYRLPFADDGVE